MTIKEKKIIKSKKLSKSAIVLIAGIVIIAIPVLIFAGILGISALQTNSPRDGSRFENDLDPAISESDLAGLESSLQAIGSVEDVEVILSEGQLKIYLDLNNSASASDTEKILKDAYNLVDSKLSVKKYFTSSDSKKMYDLEINAYTEVEASDNRQYMLLHKNSTEEAYGIDDLAHPKNPELALELEGVKQDIKVEVAEEADVDVDDSEQ